MSEKQPNLNDLPELFAERASAKELISLYPESPAAFALSGMLTLAEPEALEGEDVLKQKLNDFVNDLLK